MTRRIALIALAVVLALVGTIGVYNYAHNADKRAVASVRSVPVLMAAKTIPAGTSWRDAVKDGYLTAERVPADAGPSTAITSLTAPIDDDYVTAAQIAAGQIVVRQMFGKLEAETGILPIPKGQLAISVSMSSAADVAGFVRPNSQVAIFVTAQLSQPKGTPTSANSKQPDALGGDDLYVTKLLLPRVTVIATSQVAPTSTDKNTTTTSGNDTLLVTLAVSQHQAQQVILAQQTAQLYLGLLSDSSRTAPDGGVINITGVDASPIFLK